MMDFFANLSFAAPWAFASLLILPLIWRLIKITPPKPAFIRFPAVRLLQEMSTDEVVATKTPWWIIVLRTLFILALVVACAQPILNKQQTIAPGDGPMILIVDNDWSVMGRWQERQDAMNVILRGAVDEDQQVMIVATAEDALSWPLEFQDAQAALERGATLEPRPWQRRTEMALDNLINALGEELSGHSVIWVSNGLEPGDENPFAETLGELGDVHVMMDGVNDLPRYIRAVERHEGGLHVTLVGLETVTEQTILLQAIDDQANVLYEQSVALALGQSEQKIDLAFPSELKSRTFKIQIGGQVHAGAQYLLDERWRDRPFGLIEHAKGAGNLLDPAHYVRKSLSPHAPLREDELKVLLGGNLSVLFDFSQGRFSHPEQRSIMNWIEQGGVFVRFASEILSEGVPAGERLMPVELMAGMRNMGGALSWDRPLRLAPFALDSPFYGLSVPQDVTITQQVLARPDAQLAQKTWARLEDGTPLITAKRMGAGYSVLFHVTPEPGWSNLALSGVFEQMMIRMLTLSAGSVPLAADQLLAPYRLIDSTGVMVPPGARNEAITLAQLQKGVEPSIQHPPGLYGRESALHALNLGVSLEAISPLENLPYGAERHGFEAESSTDLAPWFFFAALCLAIIDWTLSLVMRNTFRQAGLVAGVSFLLILPAQAKENIDDLQRVLASANQMRLAYMETGDDYLDRISKKGLDGLAMILRRRTAVELAETMPFDPETDEPSLYPMIYWPINTVTPELSLKASQKLKRFLNTGGFILFDTMGEDQPQVLSDLADELDIGQLQRVSEEHVLSRSFYLMRRFPGRFDQGEIWVEANADSANDSVSSVVVGANGWAHAWARDESLRPLYPVVPGGEHQREHAYRFGVNLVMYVLSGNYKGDQVHIPAILQRLGL